MQRFVKGLKRLEKSGLFHVIGSSCINKIIAFVTNVVIVKLLSKYDYGLFSSAFNVFLIVVLFSGFGITSATLFFASNKETETERRLTYKFAMEYGSIINSILCLGIAIYGLFGNVGIEESRPHIVSLSIMPLLYFYFDYFSIILRTRNENKRYALLLNVNSVSYLVFASLGSYFGGITGTIVGRYLSYLVSAVMGFSFARRYIQFRQLEPVKKEKKHQILKYASYSGVVSALNNILYRIDITLISYLLADASLLATYKVAALVPENMNFLPQSIIIVFLPLFVENSENVKWIADHAKRLYKYMALLCGTISILMMLFAQLIIQILWGPQYLEGVPILRVLAGSFFFLGVFRSTSTNILQALGKVKFNFYVSIIAGVLNVILDITLIKRYGIMGAAIATLLVTIIASILSVPYLIKHLNKPRSQKG